MMAYKDIDCTQVEKWEVPEENGIRLIGMPNVPIPLHFQNPRTIMGKAKWDIMRKRCYMNANYTCEVCGAYLGCKNCQAHEAYEINYTTYTSTFKRLICICPQCHNAIHSGRTFSCYKNNERGYERDKLLANLKRAARLIQEWNLNHPNEEPLRLFSAYYQWLQDPKLGKWALPIFNQYGLKLYRPCEEDNVPANWKKWKLVYNGKEYYSKFESIEEWQDYNKALHTKEVK